LIGSKYITEKVINLSVKDVSLLVATSNLTAFFWVTTTSE
jgi:hypothetical protein